MTSYANDTTQTAAAPPATTTTTQTTTATTGTETAAAATTPAAASAKQMSGNHNNNNNNSNHYEEDDNSSLEGREKADTTPENIKKIAEIISGNEAAAPKLQQQHQLHTTTSNFVGLGAAIDESNAKFCLGKPPPSPAEKGE